MTEDNEQEASELAKQAAGQGKAAARSAGQALKAVGEDVVETVAEETRDATEKIEDTAEDALNTARRVNPKILSRISGDTGVGFLALSVSIYSGAVAFHKFRSALAGRSRVFN